MKYGLTSLLTRVFAAGVLALSVAVYSSAGVTSAASRSTATGCPAAGNHNDNSGVTFVGLLTPQEGVALSVAQITDAWYAAHETTAEAFIAERLGFVELLDKNGDGLICVATSWGENLNPNSHWAVVEADLLSPPATERWGFADNHMGTSNKR